MRTIATVLIGLSLTACIPTTPKYIPPDGEKTAKVTFSMTSIRSYGVFKVDTFLNSNECSVRRHVIEINPSSPNIDILFDGDTEIALRISYLADLIISSSYGDSIFKFIPKSNEEYLIELIEGSNHYSWKVFQRVDKNLVSIKSSQYKESIPWDDSGKFCKGNRRL